MNLLTTADWLVIAAYFAVLYAVVFRHSAANRANPTEFFLAGRNAGWFIVGASIFATNIGSEHLVGLAGSGASGAFPAAQFELIAVFALLLLGWLFVPFYLRSGVFTMPEFLEARYSSGVRFYLAAISIVGYVLTKISVTIAAGGIVFEALMGIDFWTGAVIVVLATGVYTVIGGMRAVLVSDMFQMFVMIGGAIVVTVVGLEAVGGWGELRAAAPPEFMSLWRATSDPDFPWTGILFGAPILAVWYWCTDQYIVQRTLAAKSIGEARRATFFAAALKLTPLFIFVVPGVIAYVLAQRGELTLADPDSALPTLIGSLLPAGLRGLVVAGLLAALMSSLSSVFNSCATLVTMDVYKRLAPHHSERRLVLVGPSRDRAHGAVRPRVDPADGRDLGPALRLSAKRASLHLAADRGRVPDRRAVAARERARRAGRSADGPRAGLGEARARAEPRVAVGLGRAARVDQLPALRDPAVRALRGRARARQPLDAAARRRARRAADDPALSRQRRSRNRRAQPDIALSAVLVALVVAAWLFFS